MKQFHLEIFLRDWYVKRKIINVQLTFEDSRINYNKKIDSNLN